MKEVIVIGAGIIGLSTAIALRQRGNDIILVDKEGLGAGASYGNTGVIQSEAMIPYGMPRAISNLARILLGCDTNVALRFPGIFKLARPLASYYLNSSPAGLARAAQSYSKLIRESARAHLELADLAGAQEQIRSGGYRMRYTRQFEMDKALRNLIRQSEDYDLPLRKLSPDEFLAAEPGVADTGVGAIEWSSPYHVERPHRLLQSYFDYFQSIGGNFVQGDAQGLSNSRAGWSMPTNQGTISAEHIVIATGAQTGRITRKFGGAAPILPKRGYHAVLAGGSKLNAPLLDAEPGFAFAPQGDYIRVTTGAELGGNDATAKPRQLQAAMKQAEFLFGTDPVPVSTWSGVRPCMPDMLPVMGKSQRHKGMWYNFGHGHQGLTMGPFAGRLLAEAFMGQHSLDPALGPARFSL